MSLWDDFKEKEGGVGDSHLYSENDLVDFFDLSILCDLIDTGFRNTRTYIEQSDERRIKLVERIDKTDARLAEVEKCRCQEHQKDFISVDDYQTTEKTPEEGSDIWEMYAKNLLKELESVTEKNERLERKIKLEQTYSDSLERDIKNLEERLEGMDGENLKK